MWFLAPSSFFGYIIGVAFGVTILLTSIRKLGRKANKSVIAVTLFQRITKYKASVYVIHRQPYDIRVTVHGNGNDYDTLFNILKQQMHFPASQAIEATNYALSMAEDKPMEEKIRVALQSLDSNNKPNKMTTLD